MKKKKETDIVTNETLYALNKSLCAKEPVLSKEEIENQLEKVMAPFVKEHKDKYFMLLCREKYDFTIFNYINKIPSSINQSLIDMYECLTNRGLVTSIELTENKDALEVWLTVEDDSLVYFFFPYDLGVIEEYNV